jgi:hypothetical protein
MFYDDIMMIFSYIFDFIFLHALMKVCTHV